MFFENAQKPSDPKRRKFKSSGTKAGTRTKIKGIPKSLKLPEMPVNTEMPEVGFEPTYPYGRQILSLVRIPISPLRRRKLQ